MGHTSLERDRGRRVDLCARVARAAAAETVGDPDRWSYDHRRTWAAAPGWDAAWESSRASHPDDPDYDPGQDEAVVAGGRSRPGASDDDPAASRERRGRLPSHRQAHPGLGVRRRRVSRLLTAGSDELGRADERAGRAR